MTSQKGTIVVFGATGFVGLSVVRCAAERGYVVVASDRRPISPLAREFLSPFHDEVRLHLHDVRAQDLGGDLPRLGVLAVINAAAVTVAVAEDEPERAVQAVHVNVAGAATTARWAASVAAARFVQVSSGMVYGPVTGDRPVHETTPAAPSTIYGVTKLAGERVAARLAELAGIDLVITRLTNVFGPMELPGPSRPQVSSVAAWASRARSGEPLEVEAPNRRRDYVFVEDAARAIVDLATTADVPHVHFNVSNGVAMSDLEVARTVASLRPGGRITVGDDPDTGYRPALDAGRLLATGWRPTGFRHALERYLDWRDRADHGRAAQPAGERQDGHGRPAPE